MNKVQYSYEEYYNKVLGCFMGKCICGTMGAPYEGMKQILHLTYDKSMTQKLIPNDDLDIQLIWLEVLEKYGENITSIDLADAFYQCYPHCPGEYAYFKKNYERKIYPPASGSFNNYFYENGMGSPIRSEIWACVNPMSPENAVKMAGMDGCLDHKHDSVVAEQYLAALQSIAFAESDLYLLLDKAKKYLDKSNKLMQLYNDVSQWYQRGYDIDQIRELIIREYGHPDCTNLYQNMGIIWASLLLGRSDIITTTMLAIHCGFDTDCTAATVGAIVGLLLGGEKLKDIFELDEVYYTAEAMINREDNKISTLAHDVAAVGCYFSERELLTIELDGIGKKSIRPMIRDVTYEIKYHGEPVIQKENKITIILKNNLNQSITYDISNREKKNYTLIYPSQISVKAMDSVEVPIMIRKENKEEELEYRNNDTEVFTVFVEARDTKIEIKFGFSCGIAYQVYGPYWENVVTIPQLECNESYYKYLGNIDEIRQYHLNMICDFNHEYIPEGTAWKLKEFNALYKEVVLTKDRFSMSELFGFEGPCVAYMVRTFFCESDKKCMLYVGKSDKIKLWLNDELLLFDESYEYCTCENRHLVPVYLKQGTNQLVAKIARSSHEAIYSLLFLEEGDVMSFPKQLLI